ncbi:MAG: endonuclease domain-containing protein [Planctomycetes bacterium]|nr:endonuclease domain-containing protein [Planctomycetota bacterium]
MENDNANLRRFAREMRKEPTSAEKALWKLLRNRRLAGFKFRRQVPFGPYILDNYCVRARLVVEIDGDSHATPEGQENDRKRDAFLATNGILVLRFWNGTVRNERDAVLDCIADTCAERVEPDRRVNSGNVQ